MPYVGRLRAYDNLSVATGHAMMGLSLGPITGRLMSEILSGEPPSLAIGLLVDNATVTIENTHRILTEEHHPLPYATLHGAAEIAVPTLVSSDRGDPPSRTAVTAEALPSVSRPRVVAVVAV